MKATEEYKEQLKPPPFVFSSRFVNGVPITEEEASKIDADFEQKMKALA